MKFKVGDKIQLKSKSRLVELGYDKDYLDDLEEFDEYSWNVIYIIDVIRWDEDLLVPYGTNFGAYTLTVHNDATMESYEYNLIEMFEFYKIVGFIIE